MQSPNIINLIMAISGVERSFQFAKCFRLPEENNYERTDTLVEFHQLGITSTFLNNQEGMNLVEGLMKELVYRLYGKKIDLPFPKYDHNEMNLLYSSGKHDMRFKDCFAPNIECLKDSNMMLYMFSYDDVNKYVCKYTDKNMKIVIKFGIEK